MPDLHLGIRTHALDKENIEPIPGQLAAVFGDHAILAENGVHGILVHEFHFLGGGIQIRIEGEIMLGEASAADPGHDRRAGSAGGWLIGFHHIVQQIIKDVPGIDGHFIEFRHDAVDSEGLVAQLPGFHDLAGRLARRGIGAHMGQIAGRHIPALSIRAGHLIPGRSSFRKDNDLRPLFVFPQDFVLRAGAGAQAQRVAVGGHLVDHSAAARLRGHGYLRRHGGGYRRAEDIALGEPAPLPGIIQRMNQRQLVLAVQGFRYPRRFRGDRAEAIGREIGTSGFIYADHGNSL